jgi:tetrathionate reductase subunit B
MAKVFVLDVAKCSGCYSCQTACKDEHCNNDWSPYAKPQPDIGQFWTKLEENVEGSIPKVKSHYIVRMCNHCDKPACLESCKKNAITKRADGFVIINPELCTGCGDCAEACPYNAISKNDKLKICQKCTGCAHLLDNGYKLPRCVENCPLDALVFGEEEELKDLIMGADVWKPETGLGPRVYYRNIPGKFIAGTVYDPDEKEVIIGAVCRAVNGAKVIETISDDFGDFWFKDLKAGIYDVTLTAEGFETVNLDAVRVEKSVNLGDVPMKKDLCEKDDIGECGDFSTNVGLF